jgi:hypothetical protein
VGAVCGLSRLSIVDEKGRFFLLLLWSEFIAVLE